ncbi:MAG: hypothetical protein WCS37_12580 [Chloroflexota bacterium]|nr:hypothetical protein [Chloroflexota bacterium]
MFGVLKMRWFFTLLPRTIRYLGDGRVPFYYKILPFLFIFFFFTPVARLMSLIPLLGLLDEFTILLLSLALFTYLSEKVLKRKMARQQEDVANSTPLEIIEGDYKVMDQMEKVVKTKEALPASAHEIHLPTPHLHQK